MGGWGRSVVLVVAMACKAAWGQVESDAGLAQAGNASSEAVAAGAAGAAEARGGLEKAEADRRRAAADMLPTADMLSGRDLSAPPRYAGRRMWNDPLEVNLRAFFEGLGGMNWYRRDGWILTGSRRHRRRRRSSTSRLIC